MTTFKDIQQDRELKAKLHKLCVYLRDTDLGGVEIKARKHLSNRGTPQITFKVEDRTYPTIWFAPRKCYRVFIWNGRRFDFPTPAEVKDFFLNMVIP